MQPIAISVGTTTVPRSGFGADLYYCPNKAATCTTNNGNLQTESLSHAAIQKPGAGPTVGLLVVDAGAYNNSGVTTVFGIASKRP